jgi:hypothetical protein
MPIRINLLAEAKAAEDERRKDPVKRGAIIAAVVVGLFLLLIGWLQVRVIAANQQAKQIQSKWKNIEQSYQAAIEIHRKSLEAEEKLTALHKMSTNRFLWGSVLNAFQQTLNNIEGVHLVRIKGEQSYAISDATPNKTNGTTIVRGRPATSTEKVAVTIDAMDTSRYPGSRVTIFRDSIATQKFLQERLSKTNGLLLTSRSAPQSSPNSAGQFVTFSLQCSFPEKTR